MNVMELASGMSPAGDLVDAPIAINMVKTGVGIGLQRPLKSLR